MALCVDPTQVVNNTTNDKALEQVKRLQYENVNVLVRSALTCNYELTSLQFKKLTDLFNPRPIKYANNLVRCAHPIAAFLNHYANEQCKLEARRFKSSIDIGGTPLRTPVTTHMCIKDDSLKTNQRYTEAAFSQINIDVVSQGKHDFTDYLTDKHAFCVDGAENCYYKAEYAYSTNVYDISPETMIKIFTNHNLLVYDMWMFLPANLIDHRLHSDTDIYRNRYSKRNGVEYFKFDLLDNSDIYEHLASTWRFYATHTAIICNDFAISIEHKINYGSFFQIRLVRTKLTNSIKTRMFCLSKLVTDIVIPDMVHYVDHTKMTGDPFAKSFLVQAHFVKRAISYATSTIDVKFDYNNFSTYCNAIKNNIRYSAGAAAELVYEGIDPGIRDYERIKISLFVLVAILRFKRTQHLSYTFNYMKDNQLHYDAFFNNFCTNLKFKLRSLFNELFTSKDLKEYDISQRFIYEIEAFEPTDIELNDVIKFDINHSFYPFVKAFTHIIPPKEKPDAMEIKTPPKTTNKNELKVDVIDTKCNKVIFNPSGENGLCGFNCFQGKATTLPKTYVQQSSGNVIKLPDNWWNDEDMLAVAMHLNIPMVVHQNGTRIGSVVGVGEKLAVNLQNAHWTVVECNCKPYESYIGKYIDIPINEEHAIYVNCANENLTDGAGQALDFANKFPGYKKNIKLPLEHRATSVMCGSVQLFLAVAYNNTHEFSYQKTHEAYHEIFQELEKLTKDTNKYVYLPLLGTALFKGNLCCFKTCFKKYDINAIMCFINHKQEIDYLNTKECKHGGFVPIVTSARSVQIRNRFAQKVNYDEIQDVPTADRMQNKYRDILKHSLTKDCVRIIELTAAPGHFYQTHKDDKSKIPFIPCVYKGKGALPWTKKDKAIYYDDITELEDMLSAIDNTLLIYDFMPDVDTLKFLLRFAQDNYLVVKVDPHDDDELQVKFNTITNAGYGMDIFINEYSNYKSNELYVEIKQQDDALTDQILDNETVMNTKSIMAEDAMANHECGCLKQKQITSIINSDVTFHYKQNAEHYLDDVLQDIQRFDTSMDEVTKENVKTVLLNFPKQVTIPVVNGAAGASKSKHALKDICVKCGIMVAPFNYVIQDVKKKKNKPGMTFHVFLSKILKGKNFDYIYLDEVFAMPAMYISIIKNLQPNATIVGLGDSYQITDRDYNGMDGEFDVVYRPGKKYIDVTNRMPEFICDFIRNYVDVKTTSIVDGKIEFDNLESIKDIPGGKHDVLLTFTQTVRDEFRKICACEVITVNGAQGQTHTNVHVYTPDLMEIRQERIRYIYTAASRATHRLILHGTEETNEQFMTIIGSPIERALESFDITPAPAAVVELEPPKEKLHTKVTSTKTTIVSQNAVEAILDRIFIPSNNAAVGVIDIKTDIIPETKSKKALKFTVDSMNAADVELQGKRFSVKNYVRQYHPKNTNQVVQTAITRYTKEGKHIDKKYVKMYLNGVEKFMRHGWKQRIAAKNKHEDQMASLADYLTELQKKYPKDKDLEIIQLIMNSEKHDEQLKHHTKAPKNIIKHLISSLVNNQPNKISDLEKEWFEKYHLLISFHLKRQPKQVLDKGYDALYKAGQGISAWSKLLNVVFSTVTRTFSREFKKEVNPNVQLSYGASDADISKHFTKYAKEFNSPNYTKLVADFSEFDSSQEKQGILSSLMILKACGFKQCVLDFYMFLRTQWTLFARGNADEIPTQLFLNGEYMQHSGQPFTLDGNTLFNMACMGMCYDIKNLICAGFKGDDSIILCEDIKPSLDGERTCIDVCGYKIKAHKLKIAEYIANIILPSDGTFFPDVIRRVSRILSKIYTVDADWEEQRLSIADSMDVIFDDERLNYGAKIASYYYSQLNIHITPEEIIVLLNFLDTLRNIKHIDHVKPETWKIIHV